jgi:hypothetical protein
MGETKPQDIGWAVKQMHDGAAVRRAGWNGKGMFLVRIPAGNITHPEISARANGTHSRPVAAGPYVAMYTAQKNVVPWLCSQTDLLATDWEIAT